MELSLDGIQSIYDHFFRNKSSSTIHLYIRDLDLFSCYLGAEDRETALLHLLRSPDSQANLTILHYKSVMLNSGYSVSTVNRRLSTIRSLVKTAKKMGYIPWTLEINNEKAMINSLEGVVIDRNTISRLFSECKRQANRKKALRDYAILRLLYDLALKRNIIADLELNDFDADNLLLHIRVNNQNGKKTKKLSPKTSHALNDWIRIRGEVSGRLFLNLDHARKGDGLTGTSIYRIVKQLGEKLGIKIRPENIRQLAVQEAIEKASTVGVEFQELIAFSDHKSVKSLNHIYTRQQRVQQLISKSLSEAN